MDNLTRGNGLKPKSDVEQRRRRPREPWILCGQVFEEKSIITNNIELEANWCGSTRKKEETKNQPEGIVFAH